MGNYILAIDQGTTSTRSVIFDANMQVVAIAQEEFPQYFPHSGWVEHNPEEIWQSVEQTITAALFKAGIGAGELAAIGITNQRETTVLWDRKTGKALHNAIVWQDRRTADFCEDMRQNGHDARVSEITGLLLDPYFSGTKLAWLLTNVKGARARAEAGNLAFGTIDSFLIWRLTQGKMHTTDATNAARTLLFDIGANQWSEEMLALLEIPATLLPEVKDCADDFGLAHIGGFDVPIYGVAGDQQAAAIGQACFKEGMIKSTYGTGCFVLLNTGKCYVRSQNRLLSTIAYRLNGEVTYALEGSIFIAGAVVQWLRDGLGVIKNTSETQALAEAANPEHNIVLVPAFTGLGAPYWKPEARGAVFGLTRSTGPAEMTKAALEAVGLQTYDLLSALQSDLGKAPEMVLRVDGGLSANDWSMQFLADIIATPVERPKMLESTVLGAAWLAGARAGLFAGIEEFSATWRADGRFEPKMNEGTRRAKLNAWRKAVEAVIRFD